VIYSLIRTIGHNGAKYFLSFVDDHSRCVAIEFLKTKDQTASKVKHYVAYLERQYGMQPKAFRANNGGEYVNKDLANWCESKGIKFEYTAPHSPEQNGVAERMNRTLAELMRAMLITWEVPTFLWPEAVVHAAYLRNRTHTWVLDRLTPLESWCGQRPNVSHLQEFGSPVWVLIEGQNVSKLEPKSEQHTFVGFADGPKAVRYYNRRTHQVCVSRNYCFPNLKTSTHPVASHEPLVPCVSSKGKRETIPLVNEHENMDHINKEVSTGHKRKIGNDEENSTIRRSK